MNLRIDHARKDVEAGGRAAVMGGVTGVFEMPNTNPLTITEAALADKVERATDRMHCDFAFYVGGTRENAAELPELEQLPGCCGVKVFMGSSTGSLLVDDDEGVWPYTRSVFADDELNERLDVGIGRFTVHTALSAASKVSMEGGGMVRFQ